MLWRPGREGTERNTNIITDMMVNAYGWLLPRLSQGALQDQGNMRNTLRANVAEKLADIWLATHLREKYRERIAASHFHA